MQLYLLALTASNQTTPKVELAKWNMIHNIYRKGDEVGWEIQNRIEDAILMYIKRIWKQ